MSALYGFTGRKEVSLGEVATGLSMIWDAYQKRGWGERLSNPDNGKTEFGVAIRCGDSWAVTKTFFEGLDGLRKIFDYSGLSNVAAQACIAEITRFSYSGYDAPIGVTCLGAGGVVGQITDYMENVVGVVKDAPACIGGGIGFLDWMARGNYQERIADCKDYALFVACVTTVGRLTMIRSKGAIEDRLFYNVNPNNGVTRFASVREALICGLGDSVSVVPVGTVVDVDE